MRLAALALLLLIGCRPLDAGAPIPDAALPGTAKSRPPYVIGQLRIIDGDTFEMQGETIRIANIDAPELSPRSECIAEANLAAVARRDLDGILGGSWEGGDSAVLPTIHRAGRDRYGRTLATVVAVDGKDVGEELVSRGVAVRWTGKRADWCGA